MKIFYKKKHLSVGIKKAGEFGKYSGLMFRTRETDNLLFNFNNYKTFGIHSYFVFFSFMAIWLDKNNKVVDFDIVKPFTLLCMPSSPSIKLLELPLNNRNKKIIDFLVGKRKI